MVCVWGVLYAVSIYSMAKQALIFQGGWEGHCPEQIAERYQRSLTETGFEVTVKDSLDCLNDAEALKAYDLIVPNWTMGELTKEQEKNLCSVVAAGIGLAGAHGGMGDAFRASLNYNYMVGGHFVSHPYVGPYTVRVDQPDHPLTPMLPPRFLYDSEQYYLQVDPGVNILLSTDYDVDGRTVNMPVAWIKKWGQGRVFYCALGHKPEEYDEHAYVWEFIIAGCLWASN